jgi:hypothetical protein
VKLSTLLAALIVNSPTLRMTIDVMRTAGQPIDIDDAAAYLMAYYSVMAASRRVRVVYSPTRDLAC